MDDAISWSGFKNKTILMTGGTGYLGSRLLKNLVASNNRFLILKRSTSDTSRLTDFNSLEFFNLDEIRLEDVFHHNPIDIIIHCATTYSLDANNLDEIIDSNLMLPLRLIELSKQTNKSIFINTDTILDERVNSYALAKKQFLAWLKLASNQMTCINISLDHFYGPLDNKFKFCTQMISYLLQNTPEIKLSPGLQKRDFIFIEDVVSAYLRILNHSLELPHGFHQYEVGTGVNTSIKSCVELMKKIIGNSKTLLNFGAYSYRPNEVMEYQVDLTAIQSIGWKPQYDLMTGLKNTIQQEITRGQ